MTARLIKRELERHLRQQLVSHVGGPKLSAKVLVYRKKQQLMIWLACVRPEHCEGIVNYTILQGKVLHPETQLRGEFDKLRGLMIW